jgi:hypothetical protein
MFGSALGKMTIERRGKGWIVLEDGRRVGGTVRHPFTSQEAAQRYLNAELAEEAETMAAGDVALSARCRVIRDTDPEVWARFLHIEEKFADDDEAAQEAHEAAGTSVVMVKLALASREAKGKIEGAGDRGEQRVYRLRGPAS